MKSLFNKIVNSSFAIALRNNLNIKPAVYYYSSYSGNAKKLYNSSLSDSFCWRTDNGYETKFKFADILNLFFGETQTWVEIEFFDKNNKFIKKVKLDNLNYTNEIIIDSNFLNGLKDYGSFYIYHFSNKKENLKKNALVNRCYVGYSLDKNLYSFVHGNTIAKFKYNDDKNKNFSDLVCTSLFKNHYYKIQKYFKNFDKNELIFSNPTSKKVKFSINGKKDYILNGGHSILIELNDHETATIKSNCLWLRPVVFSYKNKFVDVHHS